METQITSTRSEIDIAHPGYCGFDVVWDDRQLCDTKSQLLHRWAIEYGRTCGVSERDHLNIPVESFPHDVEDTASAPVVLKSHSIVVKAPAVRSGSDTGVHGIVPTLVQPSSRGTLPATLWALLHIHALDAAAFVAVLPAFPSAMGRTNFHRSLQKAFATAERRDAPLVSFGISATCRLYNGSPDTGLDATQGQAVVGLIDALLALISAIAPGYFRLFAQAYVGGSNIDSDARIASLYPDLVPADFVRRILVPGIRQISALDVDEAPVRES